MYITIMTNEQHDINPTNIYNNPENRALISKMLTGTYISGDKCSQGKIRHK